MGSRKNPFQPPTTVGGAISRFVIVLGLLWICRRLALVLELPFEAGTFILIVVVASLTVADSVRRRNLAETGFVGIAYLWLVAVLGLLYTATRASEDSWMLPLVLVVIGLGTLVVSLRQSFYPAADDSKKKPSHPLADELI